MSELEVYRRFNLPLLFWPRVGDDPQEWKGPHVKGWNSPTRVYDFHRYDPAVHNLGTFVARRLLRRLVGPLTLWDASEPDAAWVDWETVLTPALLEGLAPIHVVASPKGVERFFLNGSALLAA
jgi:hypothetical protein